MVCIRVDKIVINDYIETLSEENLGKALLLDVQQSLKRSEVILYCE